MKPVSSTWLFASFNKGKGQEIAAYLAPLHISIVGPEILRPSPPQETGVTFADNALLKARAYERLTDLPILADDSGLLIPALDNFPGVSTAGYAKGCGSYEKAFKSLEAKLKGKETSAIFVCVLVLLNQARRSYFFEGRVQGTLVFPPRGEQGFGFAPIFQPLGLSRTLGEMTQEERSSYNHRGQALSHLIDALNDNTISL